MRGYFLLTTSMIALTLALNGCACEGDPGSGDGGSEGMDARIPDGGEQMLVDGQIVGSDGDVVGSDGNVITADGDVIGVDSGGDVIVFDGGILLPDGAVVACLPATCNGRIRACGDCLDNDDDGLIDSRDPGCIGPCDNSEDVYDLQIPGGDTATCMRDCYYDDDQGPGNDGCSYDQRCDPLEPDAPRCPHTAEGGPVRCPATQTTTCVDNCTPLVPNGCDCFGCCELPAGSGSYVFLGSAGPDGQRTCEPDNIDDPTLCRPCTPYAGCMNDCDTCELCIGKDTLPPECFPPPPPPADAGVPRDDAGNPIDAGPYDAGSYDAGPPVDAGPPPPPRCNTGVQPCGLVGDDPCPSGNYCLTGCCIYLG